MRVNPWLWLLARFRRPIGGAPGTRRLWRRLPSAKRCKEWFAPFQGVFSIPLRIVQIRPSRKNPNLCTM